MDEPIDPTHLGLSDLLSQITASDRDLLVALVTSSTWPLLKDKIWKALRQGVVTQMLTSPPSDISRLQGIYAGLKSAEDLITACSQPRKSQSESVLAKESKLSPPQKTGGML